MDIMRRFVFLFIVLYPKRLPWQNIVVGGSLALKTQLGVRPEYFCTLYDCVKKKKMTQTTNIHFYV